MSKYKEFFVQAVNREGLVVYTRYHKARTETEAQNQAIRAMDRDNVEWYEVTCPVCCYWQ